MREHKSRQCHQINTRESRQSYAEVMAYQPEEARNAHPGAQTKTMSDMYLDIRKSVRI